MERMMETHFTALEALSYAKDYGQYKQKNWLVLLPAYKRQFKDIKSTNLLNLQFLQPYLSENKFFKNPEFDSK